MPLQPPKISLVFGRASLVLALNLGTQTRECCCWISQYDHPLGCASETARWYSTNLILDLFFFAHAPKNHLKNPHSKNVQSASKHLATYPCPPPTKKTQPFLLGGKKRSDVRQNARWPEDERWCFFLRNPALALHQLSYKFWAKGVLPHPWKRNNSSPGFSEPSGKMMLRKFRLGDSQRYSWWKKSGQPPGMKKKL